MSRKKNKNNTGTHMHVDPLHYSTGWRQNCSTHGWFNINDPKFRQSSVFNKYCEYIDSDTKECHLWNSGLRYCHSRSCLFNILPLRRQNASCACCRFWKGNRCTHSAKPINTNSLSAAYCCFYKYNRTTSKGNTSPEAKLPIYQRSLRKHSPSVPLAPSPARCEAKPTAVVPTPARPNPAPEAPVQRRPSESAMPSAQTKPKSATAAPVQNAQQPANTPTNQNVSKPTKTTRRPAPAPKSAVCPYRASDSSGCNLWNSGYLYCVGRHLCRYMMIRLRKPNASCLSCANRNTPICKADTTTMDHSGYCAFYRTR